MTLDTNGITFDTSALLSILEERRGVATSGERTAFGDLVDLIRYTGPTLAAVEFDAIATLREWHNGLASNSRLHRTLGDLGVVMGSGTGTSGSQTGTEDGEIFLGSGATDTFSALGGKDVLDRGGGRDWLYGRDDKDTLKGGTGVDYLIGEAGDDVLEGGADDASNLELASNPFYQEFIATASPHCARPARDGPRRAS